MSLLSPKPLADYERSHLSENSSPNQRYMAYASWSLTRYQMLERELKNFLLISSRTKGGVVAGDDAIVKWNFQKLVQKFRKHGGSAELSSRLDAMVPSRKYLAHEAFVIGQQTGELSFQLLTAELERVMLIAKSVEGVPLLVALATGKIPGRPSELLLRIEPRDEGDATTTSHAGIP